MCNNKYYVPEFPGWKMIVSLYDSSISGTYRFMFAIQSMIITPSPKAKAIYEITCYLYHLGLLFVTNIIISRILVLFYFMINSHSSSYKSWFPHHTSFTSLQNLTTFLWRIIFVANVRKLKFCNTDSIHNFLWESGWHQIRWLTICTKWHKFLHSK